MSTEYLSFHHLSKTFQKDPVLKDISATLERGHILGFLGPSGAGKTTTINSAPLPERPMYLESAVRTSTNPSTSRSVLSRMRAASMNVCPSMTI